MYFIQPINPEYIQAARFESFEIRLEPWRKKDSLVRARFS